MPHPVAKKIQAQTGLSMERIEQLWVKAQGLVRKQYPDVKYKSEKFYKLVMGIWFKMTRYKKAVTQESILDWYNLSWEVRASIIMERDKVI